MKKDFILGLLILAVVMLGLPFLAVTFVPSDAGMIVLMLLFYGINPSCSVLIGIFAGKNRKSLWSLPLLSAAFFLTGAWIFLGMGENIAVGQNGGLQSVPAEFWYAGVYAFLGMISMQISHRVRG